MNKDEAIRCLAIAQKHRDAGNFSSARKFAQKSISLFETPEALKMLDSIDAAEAASSSGSSGAGSSSSNSTTASGAEAHPSSSGTKHRHTQSTNGSAKPNGTASGAGGEKRDYTTEQLAMVKKIRACKITEYYEILSLKKDCEEADIKRAYRKLALALHPDKNGAPGADEAFKMVSKAFQVLSDPQKRAIHDQSGSDPEDRFGGMPSRSPGFSSFGGRAGGDFEGEISPEDLFNMFFGGGGGPAFGGGFGGGPVFTATFGPGGFRTTRMGGGFGPGVARHEQQANAEPRSPPVPDPRYSFQPTSRYYMEIHTPRRDVAYHVNPTDFMSHPILGPELQRDGIDLKDVYKKSQKMKADREKRRKEKAAKEGAEGEEDVKDDQVKVKRGPAMAKFEDNVERTYINEIYAQCKRGLDRKERARDAEVGLFGIGTDWKKVKEIEDEVIPACKELDRLNHGR